MNSLVEDVICPPVAEVAADLVKDLPKLVTPDVAAELLAVSPRTLRRWVDLGRVVALKTSDGRPGRVRIPKKEIERLIRTMMQ